MTGKVEKEVVIYLLAFCELLHIWCAEIHDLFLCDREWQGNSRRVQDLIRPRPGHYDEASAPERATVRQNLKNV